MKTFTFLEVTRILETVRAECIASKFNTITKQWSEVTYDTDDCITVDAMNAVLDNEIKKLKK